MINKSVIFSARTDSYRALYSMGVVLINSSAIAPIREGRATLFRRRSSPSLMDFLNVVARKGSK